LLICFEASLQEWIAVMPWVGKAGTKTPKVASKSNVSNITNLIIKGRKDMGYRKVLQTV
jgi:hypothetical protein